MKATLLINKDGVRSLYPNSFLDDIDLSKFGERAKTKCAIVVPIHMPFSQIGAVSYNPIDEKITDLSEVYAAYATELDICPRLYPQLYECDPTLSAFAFRLKALKKRGRVLALGGNG